MGYVLDLDYEGQKIRIGANAEDVNYGNTNVKAKLDDLQEQINAGSGGGSSGTTDITINGGAPIYRNNPYPKKDVLKILAIGNSFTEYPCDYLSGMLSASGVDASKIGLWKMTYPASSLEIWLGEYEKGEGAIQTNLALYKACGSASLGDSSIASDKKSVAMQLSRDWDIIVFQQVSSSADVYNTYNPYLKKLVQAVRRHCPNPNVAIAWQEVWTRKKTKVTTYDNVVAATQAMAAYNGIDIIIPSGTAIENARNTNAWSGVSGYLLEDGVHPAWGVGKYVTACAWWETLIAPHYGVSILGNTYTHPAATGSGIDMDYSGTSGKYGGVPVTAENRELCQLCAVYAIGDMYNITTGID